MYVVITNLDFLSGTADEQTGEEKERFQFLCEEKVKVVLERNEIVDQQEEERVQYQKDEATDAGFDDDYEETQRYLSETSDGKCCVYNNIMCRIRTFMHLSYCLLTDESDIQEDP